MKKDEKLTTEYWINMAYSLTKQGKDDKAKMYYEKALELEPDNMVALINLGKRTNNLNEAQEAKKHLFHAIKIFHLRRSMD